jgi:hypothetical protein
LEAWIVQLANPACSMLDYQTAERLCFSPFSFPFVP